MTHDEVIDLLTTAAAYDRRKVGEADVIAWHAAVGDLDYPDAQTAVVGHYTETTDWLMPAHVRVRVKAIRARRLERAVLDAPASDGDPRDYQAQLQQGLKRLAGGWTPPRAIVSGGGAEPNGEYVKARGDDPHRELRVAAMVVQCPRCKAMPGDRCLNAGNKPLSTAPAHDARLVAAGLARWVEIRGQQTAELIPEKALTSEESK
ncbi:zinc finger domain-containing protein [Streptosporangium sp. G12]